MSVQVNKNKRKHKQKEDGNNKKRKQEEKEVLPSKDESALEVAEERVEDGEEKKGNHKNVPDNILLFTYYKEILKKEDDFVNFKQSLHTKLQTTFRIGGDDVISKTFLKRMENSPSFKELEQSIKIGKESIPPPAPIAWYPNNKAWKYSVSGEWIRRSRTFEKVHEFLVAASNSGDIWRQEEASMIPPCFLDAKPNHRILDMCAAPGSKTAQIHDLVFGKRNYHEIPTGCIIANDSSHKRCLLLSQRLTKTSSPHLLVTNHEAQHFPLKTGGQRLRFDRILCDVPCSGDGTLRKLPSKAWADWSPSSAFSLHSLQAAIVIRGLELLGVNGRLVFSTCSMNPVENEAVVSTILQKLKGHVELVDVSNQIIGLKRNKGLNSWRIMDEKGNWYSSFKDVPESLHTTILPTMFPIKGMDVSRCIRIFPHTQDTSGFFVAVFKITKIIDNDKPPEVPKNTKQAKRNSPPPRFTSLWGDGNANSHPDLVNGISSVYHTGNDMPWRACFARKLEISEKKVRHVVLFSDSLRDILQHNKKDAIHVVNGGVQIFERTTKDFSIHTNFKISSLSLPYLVPFLLPKRVITLSHPSNISSLFLSLQLPYNELNDPVIFQTLKKLSAGYVVVKFNLDCMDKKEEDKKEEDKTEEINKKGNKKGKNNKKESEEKKEKEERDREGEREEGMVVCRNGGWNLALCASSTEVWSIKFLLHL